MQDCIFCKIIKGEIPSSKVYEDDEVIAFLTIEAINLGHTLVVPKKHVNEFQEIEKNVYQKVMSTVKEVARSLKQTYKPERVGLLVQGFEVPHAHIHVVPLNDATDVTSKKLLEKTTLKPSPKELSEEASKIKNNL